eukprot:TRINITY_DN7277_c0_g1_i1.p1 TRINITY_DN7277_c0_g1~~TRINITY_DN7277_c0_g1_i1.p1  ORF type:complete len:121 (+),score=33.36 TRINITY_DN7277_c0_g1_i1:30-365(+)
MEDNQRPQPHLLNQSFSVVSYTGGAFDDLEEYQVSNILGNENPHCSINGSNWDLVLEYTKGPEFTLTHLVIHPANRCTSPTKTLVFWLSHEPPKVDLNNTNFNSLNPRTLR